MVSEAGTDYERQGTSAPAFWWRLTDNAFRRIVWLLLPVVLFAMLGLWQASNTLDLYRSSGLLSASSNPLVPEQQIGGVAQPQFWETPATAASRTMNEQLRTDSFVETIAEQAGLKDAIDAGLLDLVTVRGALWTSADGTSLVTVNALWGDPQTAFGLVDGMIIAYQEFLAESVASQSSEAEVFYREQRDEAQAEVDAAQIALEEFVATAGDLNDDDRSLTVDLQLNRLTNALDAAEAKVEAAQAQIDLAELAVTQSRSEAGRSLTVIDAPKVPTAPQSTFVERAMTVVSFTLLGVVIMLGALVVGSVLDQSVASSFDLRGLDGVEHVAVVPVLRLAKPRATRATRANKRRRRRRAAEPEPEPQKVSV